MRRTLLKSIAGGVALAAAMSLGGVAKAADTITLKMHHFLPPVAPAHSKMLAPWAKQIEEASKGRIKIDIYPSMQLGGKPPQLIDQVRDGVVDIVWTLPGYSPGRFVKTEAFELPFMHTTTTATTMALQDYAEQNADEFNDYKVILLFAHAGQVLHSHKAIRTADDLKGLKIRTPTRTGGWMIEAMGATPVGAPVPKIPEMLSKKVVDAVMIPYEVTLPLKTAEMVDFHTTLDGGKYTRPNTSVFIIAMNKKKFDSLPKDLQQVIDDHSGRNMAGWVAKVWDDVEVPGAKKAAASGELITMSAAETAKLRERTEKPVTDRWIADVAKKGVDGQALVDQAKALIEKYTK